MDTANPWLEVHQPAFYRYQDMPPCSYTRGRCLLCARRPQPHLGSQGARRRVIDASHGGELPHPLTPDVDADDLEKLGEYEDFLERTGWTACAGADITFIHRRRLCAPPRAHRRPPPPTCSRPESRPSPSPRPSHCTTPCTPHRPDHPARTTSWHFPAARGRPLPLAHGPLYYPPTGPARRAAAVCQGLCGSVQPPAPPQACAGGLYRSSPDRRARSARPPGVSPPPNLDEL